MMIVIEAVKCEKCAELIMDLFQIGKIETVKDAFVFVFVNVCEKKYIVINEKVIHFSGRELSKHGISFPYMVIAVFLFIFRNIGNISEKSIPVLFFLQFLHHFQEMYHSNKAEKNTAIP